MKKKKNYLFYIIKSINFVHNYKLSQPRKWDNKRNSGMNDFNVMTLQSMSNQPHNSELRQR